MSKDNRAKRFKRENRASKKTTWYCAGCKARHPLGENCKTPRLYAPGFTRSGATERNDTVRNA